MTRANDPSKLPSTWIQWLSYVLQRKTFWPCMIMCITWYSIFQICPSNVFGLCDFGLWLVTLGFPLMAVEQVEIKFSVVDHKIDMFVISLPCLWFCMQSTVQSPIHFLQKTHMKNLWSPISLTWYYLNIKLQTLTNIKQIYNMILKYLSLYFSEDCYSKKKILCWSFWTLNFQTTNIFFMFNKL